MDVNAIFKANSYVKKPLTINSKSNDNLNKIQNNIFADKKTEMSWYLDIIFKDI